MEYQKEKCSSNCILYKNTKWTNISKVFDSINIELAGLDTIFFFEGSYVDKGEIIGRIWCKKVDLRYEIWGNKFLYYLKTDKNNSEPHDLNFLLEDTYKETFALIEKKDFNKIKEISNNSKVMDGGCFIAGIITKNNSAIESICFHELSKSLLKQMY